MAVPETFVLHRLDDERIVLPVPEIGEIDGLKGPQLGVTARCR